MDRSIDSRERDEGNDSIRSLGPARDGLSLRSPQEIRELREIIDSVKEDRPSLPQLLDRLERMGVRPVPSLQRSGRLNGMSYELNGVRYKGSDLGREYTASGLQKQGVRYDPAADEGRLREFVSRARERPGRAFHRPLDLRERSLRVREYDGLHESERAAMREVGRFRTVAIEDFVAIHYRGDHDRWGKDFNKLSGQNLMEARSVVITTHDRDHQADTRSLEVLVLTKRGKDLLRRFDRESRDSGQALYAGLVKPKEIAHDAAIYRMFHAEAAHLSKEGSRVRRVVLDFELKRKVYAPLAKAQRISPEEYRRKHAEVALQNRLKVVDGKIRLPDLRIEYEKANGEAARVDLELATEHYRGDHMSAKSQAGFKIYADSRSFPPGGSYGRGSVIDDHEIQIFSF